MKKRINRMVFCALGLSVSLILFACGGAPTYTTTAQSPTDWDGGLSGGNESSAVEDGGVHAPPAEWSPTTEVPRTEAPTTMMAPAYTAQTGSAQPNGSQQPYTADGSTPEMGVPQFSGDGEAAATALPGIAQSANGALNRYLSYYSRGEEYRSIDANDAISVDDTQLSTVSLKVDTASHTNIERFLTDGMLPPKDAVRIEEMVNYYRYDIPTDFGDDTFKVGTEISPSPLNEGKYVALIHVKSREIDRSALPPSNLTFLIDVSGSMNSYDKLPLLKSSFGLLIDSLGEADRVSVVTYSDSSNVLADSISGADKTLLHSAVDGLQASGSTAGEGGIQAAYALAEKNFTEGGNNRVILATDGDFNVGTSDIEELSRLIAEKRDSGVFLSIMGFGTGNIRDDIMETLSKDGNGNYSYINSLQSAKKALIDEMTSNLFVVAGDVKTQVEFNPVNVEAYKLIGYENRLLNNEDFKDDTKDAGEIGAGTDVVIMYELTPRMSAQSDTAPDIRYGQSGGDEAAVSSDAPQADSAAFGTTTDSSAGQRYADELFEVRIRYKSPGSGESKQIALPATFSDILPESSVDFKFACAVAGFGQMLREPGSAPLSLSRLISLASSGLGQDIAGYRIAFTDMMRRYGEISGNSRN